MVTTRRRKGEPPPVYGAGNDVFSVEIHHGGFFVGHGENRAYIDEKVDWFDHCEIDSWSPLWIDDFVSELGYEKSEALKTYWLLPGKSLADGLRVIVNDADTLVMASIVEKVKTFVLYFDHDDNIAALNWNDIVANPIETLPKFFSPKKVHIIEKKVDEKLPSFYSNIRSRGGAACEQGAGQGPSTVNEEAQVDEEMAVDEPGSEDSDSDPDFVDSDYEVDQDDDDLFVDNVDMGISDKGVVYNKKAAGSRTKGQRAWKVNQDGEEVSTDGEDLELPESDVEGEPSFNFKSFREEDMGNPVFKIGMVFSSVQILRKAITEYSLKHRVDIKMPRNEKKRLTAHCAEGCPWNLHASTDSWCGGLARTRAAGQRYHGKGTEYKGAVLARVHRLITRTDKMPAMREAFYRQNLPNVISLLATCFFVPIAIFFQGLSIVLLVRTPDHPGFQVDCLIKISNVSYGCIILHRMLAANLYVISKLLYMNYGGNKLVNQLGTWKGSKQPIREGGIAYYIAAPPTRNKSCLRILTQYLRTNSRVML